MIPFKENPNGMIKNTAVLLILFCITGGCVGLLQSCQPNDLIGFHDEDAAKGDRRNFNYFERRSLENSPYIRDVRADSRQSRIDARDIRTDFREIRTELGRQVRTIRNQDYTRNLHRINENKLNNGERKTGNNYLPQRTMNTLNEMQYDRARDIIRNIDGQERRRTLTDREGERYRNNEIRNRQTHLNRKSQYTERDDRERRKQTSQNPSRQNVRLDKKLQTDSSRIVRQQRYDEQTRERNLREFDNRRVRQNERRNSRTQERQVNHDDHIIRSRRSVYHADRNNKLNNERRQNVLQIQSQSQTSRRNTRFIEQNRKLSNRLNVLQERRELISQDNIEPLVQRRFNDRVSKEFRKSSERNIRDRVLQTDVRLSRTRQNQRNDQMIKSKRSTDMRRIQREQDISPNFRSISENNRDRDNTRQLRNRYFQNREAKAIDRNVESDRSRVKFERNERLTRDRSYRVDLNRVRNVPIHQHQQLKTNDINQRNIEESRVAEKNNDKRTYSNIRYRQESHDMSRVMRYRHENRQEENMKLRQNIRQTIERRIGQDSFTFKTTKDEALEKSNILINCVQAVLIIVLVGQILKNTSKCARLANLRSIFLKEKVF